MVHHKCTSERVQTRIYIAMYRRTDKQTIRDGPCIDTFLDNIGEAGQTTFQLLKKVRHTRKNPEKPKKQQKQQKDKGSLKSMSHVTLRSWLEIALQHWSRSSYPCQLFKTPLNVKHWSTDPYIGLSAWGTAACSCFLLKLVNPPTPHLQKRLQGSNNAHLEMKTSISANPSSCHYIRVAKHYMWSPSKEPNNMLNSN